jgi:hypothetical protein
VNKKLREIDALKVRELPLLDAQAKGKLAREAELRLELDILEGRRSPRARLSDEIVDQDQVLDVSETIKPCRDEELVLESSEDVVGKLNATGPSLQSTGQGNVTAEAASADSGGAQDDGIPDSWRQSVDDAVGQSDTVVGQDPKSPLMHDDDLQRVPVVSEFNPDGALVTQDLGPALLRRDESERSSQVEKADRFAAQSSDIPDSWLELADADDQEESNRHSALADSLAHQSASLERPSKDQCNGHSRQRKNWVNLNKAVSKWQKCLVNGSMTEAEFEARIMASPVAMHLQALHGDQFRIDELVQNVRQHAARGTNVRHAAGGA